LTDTGGRRVLYAVALRKMVVAAVLSSVKQNNASYPAKHEAGLKCGSFNNGEKNMSAIRQDANASAPPISWVEMMQSAGPRFAAHGVACDAEDSFVSENYSALKQMGAFTAHIPAELGGGGASYEETAEMLRTLAQLCIDGSGVGDAHAPRGCLGLALAP
jgi:hypothetical protein